MSGWAYVASAISTIVCMILTIDSKRQQASTSDQEEEKEDCGDVVNDVAANTQEGFWDGFIKDLDEQVKLLPEKKYYGTYRTTAVQTIPGNEKDHRYPIVPTNQRARRRPRQRTKRR